MQHDFPQFRGVQNTFDVAGLFSRVIAAEGAVAQMLGRAEGLQQAIRRTSTRAEVRGATLVSITYKSIL